MKVDKVVHRGVLRGLIYEKTKNSVYKFANF